MDPSPELAIADLSSRQLFANNLPKISGTCITPDRHISGDLLRVKTYDNGA
jgi:hypothetical protein